MPSRLGITAGSARVLVYAPVRYLRVQRINGATDVVNVASLEVRDVHGAVIPPVSAVCFPNEWTGLPAVNVTDQNDTTIAATGAAVAGGYIEIDLGQECAWGSIRVVYRMDAYGRIGNSRILATRADRTTPVVSFDPWDASRYHYVFRPEALSAPTTS